MIKTSLKKRWITSISALCISVGIALACAGDWGPEYGTSNFTPFAAISDASYTPFFFSNMFYYGIGHDDGHDARFNNANTREWSGYLGKSIPSGTLDYLLQQAGPASIDSALAAGKKEPKLTAFLRYLKLARQAETYALNHITGSWEYSDLKKDKPPFDNEKFNRACREQMAAADGFVRQRYLFQMERNQFFYAGARQATDFFTLHEKDFTPGTIYYRTMAYAAGAYYKLKNYSMANYLYSRVFEGCPELRTVAHFSFHPQEESDWKATLALCRNKGEQATLWQMLGVFYSDEGRSIREIYQLDPKSEKMDLLMVRAVNIYEQKFNGSGSYGYEVKPMADSNARAIFALVTRIAEEGKTARPWIWSMAAGYLHALEGNYTAAQSWYNKVPVPKEELPRSQLRLLKLINQVGMTTKMDSRTENQLLPELEWLWAVSSHQDSSLLRSLDAFTWSRQKIAALYNKQKDSVKAQCFVSTHRIYSSDKQTAAIKAFFTRPSKSAFEDFCTRLSSIRANDISEYQAIKCGYEGRLEEAIEMITGTPGAAIVLPGNPFNARIQDCHDCDHAAARKIKYTRLSFLQKLKEIKDKIAPGTDLYANSILLGNAYYNMSDYGNARAYYECSIIGAGYEMDSTFHTMLFSNALSSKYYTQALNAATNDEQRAKCQYLLAKCERNEWYNANTGDDQHRPDFIAWKGFAALRQYRATQYYKEVLRECGYFNTYINKH
jgi:hypothetical protein